MPKFPASLPALYGLFYRHERLALIVYSVHRPKAYRPWSASILSVKLTLPLTSMPFRHDYVPPQRGHA